MANTYFQYKSITQLYRKYREVYDLLEDSEGVLDEEIEIKLREIQDSEEELGWDILQMIDALELEHKQNKERKANLDKKNKSIENSISYLETFMKQLVTKIGDPNNSGNKAKKFGERNITVRRYFEYKVDDEQFKDERFLRYSLKGKYPAAYAKRLEEYALKNNFEASLEKVVLKAELNEHIKETGILPEGVDQIKKESLIKK